jgi:NitT/TauT family transport system permease protein
MQFEPPPLPPPQTPRRQRRGRERLLSLALLLAVLAAWYGLVQWRRLPPLVLPLPTAVARALVQNLLDGFLWPHLWVTLSEIVLGFVGGSALGVGLGSLVALAPLIQRILNPYIIASQAMPKLALAPLFVIWCGFGILPKALIAALIAFFPLFEKGVIAPFPNLTSLDVDTHKGFTRVSSIVREIKWLWQYRLVTTAPLINLHPARWHGSLCCTARRYFLASI